MADQDTPEQSIDSSDQALHDAMTAMLNSREEDGDVDGQREDNQREDESVPEPTEHGSGDDETENDGASEEAEAEETTKQKEEVKILSATRADDKYEVPADAKFVHKINGEEVEVSVQDLLNNYSGKVAYDRKFQELDSKAKEFEASRSQLNDKVNNFYNLAVSGKTVEALDFLLESSGLDRNAFMSQFAAEVEPQLIQYLNMTDEEREIAAIKAENEHYKRKQESEYQRRQYEQTEMELTRRVREIQEVRGLDDAKLADLYGHITGDPKLIEGKTPSQVLDILESYAADVTDYEMSEGILSSIDKSLAKDPNTIWEFVDTYRAVSRNSKVSLTKEDLLVVAKEVYGTGSIAQDLSNKIRKTDNTYSKQRKPTAGNNQKKAKFEEWAQQLREWKE